MKNTFYFQRLDDYMKGVCPYCKGHNIEHSPIFAGEMGKRRKKAGVIVGYRYHCIDCGLSGKFTNPKAVKMIEIGG